MWQDRQMDILLETGTNELEIMEFTVGGELFGINVAKIREIMRCCPVKEMQNANPSIEGVFRPRDTVITVINLANYLGLGPSENPERDIFMITHFNNTVFGFHVHTVEGIDRVSWTNIQKPDPIIYSGRDGIATGIAEYQGRLITILDFEKIIAELSPESALQPQQVELRTPASPEFRPILVAEDSMLLSKLIKEALGRAGYDNIIQVDNGLEAWNYLEKLKVSGYDPLDQLSCVISDIEMPQMDGHHLTKRIKDDEQLKGIPVVLFSSLVSEEMEQRGYQLGADAQVTKPDVNSLIEIVDQLTNRIS